MNGRLLSGFVLEIKAGRANTRSTAFEHFKQVKLLQWDSIQNAITNLEKFCARNVIASATVGYENLMELSLRKRPSNVQMLRCLNERHQVLATRQIIGSEYLTSDA